MLAAVWVGFVPSAGWATTTGGNKKRQPAMVAERRHLALRMLSIMPPMHEAARTERGGANEANPDLSNRFRTNRMKKGPAVSVSEELVRSNWQQGSQCGEALSQPVVPSLATHPV